MRKRPFLLLILALYLCLTLGYSVINPLFEAPDEHWHYFTAQHIVENGRLPFVAPGDAYDPWLSQEAAQPPLYYLISALIIAPIDTDGAREQVWLNPNAWIGDASALANVNRMVHTPAEAWPWRGFALAAHLLRGMSTLFGLGTLLCIYGSGRLLWPKRPRRALLATALIAFLPQFNFAHAAVSNDPLIVLLVSFALWQLLRLWRGAVTRARLLLLGVTIGLAALTKNAGVLLLVYALGVLILMEIRNWRVSGKSNLRSLLSYLLLILLPALLIAGWLWWRNWILYGDWTATNQFVRLAGGDRGYMLGQVLAESDGLWLSLIAVFGWFNLRTPGWIYVVWSGIAILALAGGVWRWRKARLEIGGLETGGGGLDRFFWVANLPALWLAGWVAAVYAGLVMFMLQTEAAQGRLLFPAIVPLALGLAFGLDQLPLRRYQWIWPALALGTSVSSLLFVIRPAYARPPTVAALPPQATRLDAALGQGLTLVGAEVETETAVPGDLAWFTLYWWTDAPSTDAPQMVLELLGRQENGEFPAVGKVQGYHGRGLYPATLWPPGALVADRFPVRLEAEMATPVLARAFVHLAAEDPSAEIGAVKVTPATWPEPAGPPMAQIGEGMAITAVSLMPTVVSPGDMVQIDVQWQITAVPGADFTTLIHLALPGQPPLATGDSPPLNGQYPTRVWGAGEVINDQYQLIVPVGVEDGRYPVWIGMYEPETLTRLPLTVEGVRQPGDVYQIGWLKVQR